jgi:hypothetical protein
MTYQIMDIEGTAPQLRVQIVSRQRWNEDGCRYWWFLLLLTSKPKVYWTSRGNSRRGNRQAYCNTKLVSVEI